MSDAGFFPEVLFVWGVPTVLVRTCKLLVVEVFSWAVNSSCSSEPVCLSPSFRCCRSAILRRCWGFGTLFGKTRWWIWVFVSSSASPHCRCRCWSRRFPEGLETPRWWSQRFSETCWSWSPCWSSCSLRPRDESWQGGAPGLSGGAPPLQFRLPPSVARRWLLATVVQEEIVWFRAGVFEFWFKKFWRAREFPRTRSIYVVVVRNPVAYWREGGSASPFIACRRSSEGWKIRGEGFSGRESETGKSLGRSSTPRETFRISFPVRFPTRVWDSVFARKRVIKCVMLSWKSAARSQVVWLAGLEIENTHWRFGETFKLLWYVFRYNI